MGMGAERGLELFEEMQLSIEADAVAIAGGTAYGQLLFKR